ncbi:MAG: type II secretion system protein GspG [Phycisphaerae bacterium]|nr:type II secretion system protein GspG [Phycisphaerae bacterium]
MNVLLCTLALFCMTSDQVETSRTADTLLYIRTVPSGAQILLDGKPLGSSDGLFPVKSGAYRIVVDLEGHEPQNQQISIRDGQITRIELILEPQSVVEPAGEEAPQSPRQDFGPAIERTVYDDHIGKDWLIDLDSGTLYTPPPGLDPEQNSQADVKQLIAWMKEENIDATGIKASTGILYGFELVVAVMDSTWENVTVQAIEEALKQAPPRVVFNDQSDAPPIILGDRNKPETVYAFSTREGGTGVLQMMAVTDNGTGLRFRYQLAQQSALSKRTDYRRADPSVVPDNSNTIFAYRTATADLHSIKTALDIYNLDTGQYPTTAQGLEALIKRPVDMKAPRNWGGPYLRATSIPLDPWGHPYQYEYLLKDSKPRVWSKGEDHISETSDDIPPNEMLANRMQSGSHLAAMGKAMLIYANDHDDAYPPDLESLVSEADFHPKLLVCPTKPQGFVGPGYIYIVGQSTNMDPRNVIAYENPAFCRNGMNVLYLDSHVAWMKRDDFLQQLAATYKRLGRPMPNIRFDRFDGSEYGESSGTYDDIPLHETLANRMKSAAHLSGIGKAMLIYANDHDDAFPSDLHALVSEAELLPKQLVSPSKPIGFVGPSYVYIAGQTTLMDPRNVVAYENPGYCQDGVNVLFLDSHVFWQTPEKFMQALAATYKRLNRPVPTIQFENSDSPEVFDLDNMVFDMIIQDLDEGKGHEAIDLDNARQYDIPSEQGNDQGGWYAVQQLAREDGVDLYADYASNRWALMTSDLTLKKYVPNEFWDRLGPAEVQVLVSLPQESSQGIEILDRSGFRFYILDHLAKAPQTFAFETAQGALGVLQITEFLDKPRAIKIRYKLVKQPVE